VDPRTGQILTAPGAANTAAAIGTVIPNTGNLTNGCTVTELTPAQAAYIGVPVEGPYKPDQYRY